MRTVLNVIWLLLCGIWLAIGYVLAGWSAHPHRDDPVRPRLVPDRELRAVAVRPRARTAIRCGSAPAIGNVIWFVFAGWWLAIAHVVTAVALA